MSFHSIEQAIKDIKNGKIVIVVDSEDRENEGDFIMACEKVKASDINFMAAIGRGLICTPITSERAQELELPLMVSNNTTPTATPFTVTIDLKEGNTTGISAQDRMNTMLAMCDSKTLASDFYRPGHVFPLIANDEGVLGRDGHTEAAVDLSKLAGLYPAGVICEIMNEDGTMARVPELQKLSEELNMTMITIQDLIDYRRKNL